MRYHRIFQSVVILALLIIPTAAYADEIALWNFNDAVAGGPPSLTVDRGVGTLTTTANPINLTNFTGTTVNAQMGDPAGRDLAIMAGADLRNNGSLLELRASTVGFNSIILSWAWQRSATGFNSVLLQFSNNGTTFQDVITIAPPTSFATVTVSFDPPAGAANNPFFAWRWVLNGATDPNGNIRFDNIAVLGTPQPVPEPATVLLLGIGLGGIAANRFKRKRRQ